MAEQQVAVKVSTDANNALKLGSDGGVYAPKGQAGTSVRVLPPLDNETAIKALHAPTAGDTHLAKDTGDLWSFDGHRWNNVGHVKGDKGDKGADGPTLTAGPGITLTPKP